MRLRQLLDQLRNPAPGEPRVHHERVTPRGIFAPLLVLVAALGVALVVWSASDEPSFRAAFDRIAVLDAPDDGAGDALTPAAEADLYLPVPAVLEDERVVAAFGPIARLSCRKDDPASLEMGERAAPAATGSAGASAAPAAATASDGAVTGFDRLAESLSAAGASAEDVQSEHLLAAAASPIVMVAGALDTPSSAANGSCPALLQRTFNRLQTGKPESLCQYEGKVLLVVNTASFCGYTRQYEGLEAMYRKYKDRGLVVVGFPSNDFGKQEPGSNQEIAEFCRLTYGVQFPMYEKSSVTDLASNPLFTDLAARTGKTPQWNFHKYVVDRAGQPVASFTSQTEPNDKTLLALIERLLAERPRKG